MNNAQAKAAFVAGENVDKDKVIALFDEYSNIDELKNSDNRSLGAVLVLSSGRKYLVVGGGLGDFAGLNNEFSDLQKHTKTTFEYFYSVLSDGMSITLDNGLTYEKDSGLSPLHNCVGDLSITAKFKPVNGAENGHFGIIPDGATNWENTPKMALLRARALIEPVTFRAGYYAMGINFDYTDSGAMYHMDDGAVFGGVIHLIAGTGQQAAFSNITNATRADNVVTLTTSAAHGFSIGDFIQVIDVQSFGNGSTSFNGTKIAVTSVPSATSLTYNNFGPAAFGGLNQTGISIVSGTPVRNLKITGDLVTTDRLGTIMAKDCYIERCHIKNDPTQHIDNSKCRGAHIFYGTSGLTIPYLLIDDADGDNLDAAFAVDGGGWNPEKLDMKVHVKDSALHGSYITGRGHKIALTVDAFGYGVWPAGRVMQDANDETQSSRLRSVWINRHWDCDFWLNTNQDTSGTRGYEVDHALIDETGQTNYGQSGKPSRIHKWNANNVRRGGIKIGDPNYVASRLHLWMSNITIGLATEGLGAGLYGLNIVGASADRYIDIDNITLVDFGANKGVYVETTAQGRIREIVAVGINDQVMFSRGRMNVGEHYIRWEGGSPSDPIVLLQNPAANGTVFGLIDFDADQVITATVFEVSVSAEQYSLGKLKTRNARSINGTAILDGSQVFSITEFDMLGPDDTGVGVMFKQWAYDGYLGHGQIKGFDLGLDKGAVPDTSIVRMKAMGLSAAGNDTAGSNIPAARIQEFGTTQVSV